MNKLLPFLVLLSGPTLASCGGDDAQDGRWTAPSACNRIECPDAALEPVDAAPETSDAASPILDAAMETGDAGAVDPNTTNYLPLTGYSAPGSSADPATNSAFTNFKEIYKPGASMLMSMGDHGAPGEQCYGLRTNHDSTLLANQPRLRVYLPPGTRRFAISTITYYDALTEQAAAYRFALPPISSYDQAGLDSNFWNADPKRNLEHILSGYEYAVKSGAGGNAISGPQGGNDYLNGYSFKSAQGGWLYIHYLKLIGVAPMVLSTTTCVDPVDYEAWYQQAQWDQNGNPL